MEKEGSEQVSGVGLASHLAAQLKLLRKAKWMLIVFPEFIFAKALCELQMAVEDLHDLSLQQEAFEWEVEYGRGCQLV